MKKRSGISVHLGDLGYNRRESSSHSAAKERIAQMATRSGGDFIVAIDDGDHYEMRRLDLGGCTVVVECSETGEAIPNAQAYKNIHGRFPEMIFDVGFVRDGRVLAAIEVVRNSGITARKYGKIVGAGILCLVVKANLEDWYVDDRRIEAVQVIAPPGAVLRLEPLTAAGAP